MGLRERWKMRRSQKVCAKAQVRLQEVVDGEVPDSRERRVLEEHLERCEPCGMEAQTIRDLKDALARVGSNPDPAVKARLASLLEQIRSGDVPEGEDV